MIAIRAAAVACLALMMAGHVQAEDLVMDTAILQALDKSTARVQTLQARVGESVAFGRLEMIVRTCRKHSPEEEPETGVFIDIWEKKSGYPAKDIFRGWMFASSPGLSALEHPVYDIWLLDCNGQS